LQRLPHLLELCFFQEASHLVVALEELVLALDGGPWL
jgi:hypothetical protein